MTSLRVAAAAALGLLATASSARADDLGTPAALQYGAAFVAETRVRSGDVCPSKSEEPCILGSGGGLGLRVGHRTRGSLYLGGVYQFTKHDSSNILNLAILQQARFEARRYFGADDRLTPFVHAGAGVVAYGDEWRPETWGAGFAIGPALSLEVTPEVFAGIAPTYEVVFLRAWRDGAGQARPDGAAHFVGLSLTLEVRHAYARY